MSTTRTEAIEQATKQPRLVVAFGARRLVLVLLCAAVGLAVEPACAQAPKEERAATPAAPEPGVLPGLAAVVPGLLLHGSGTYLAKDRRAAKRLAIANGVGLGTLLLSGTLLVVTGTARRLVGVLTPLAVAGTGVFVTTWLADLYGAKPATVEEARARFGIS